MKVTQILIAILGLFLTIMVVLAAFEAPINESFSRITQDLWGWVTLLDLYLGFILMAIFIAIIERENSIAFMWIVPLFFLGNIWSALWFVIRFGKIVKKIS